MATTLHLWSRGHEVQRLQKALNKHLRIIPKLYENGQFGPQTEAAVRQYQASVGLGIDGIVGPRTWMSLEKGFVTHPVAVASMTDNPSDAPWMAVAAKEIGQKEKFGVKFNNPRIIEYFVTTSFKAKTDETSWCSAFVNWCLQQVKIKGTNSAAAASWLNWGKESAVIPGAITVIYNSNAKNSSLTTSGNHVGFMEKETASHYRLLGGNQSNQVRVSSYPKSSWKLKGCRWPNSQSEKEKSYHVYV
ncbi:TIGR02594 family protein [bacterium]|nr:TIGR02594 family protein [bacterium]MBU1754109.1 TIGR02594 family protein [bacterium]